MGKTVVTVISPHLDDAAFSLGITIARLSQLGYGVKIVNCYTVSKYAPYSGETCLQSITALRLREDAEFLANIPSLQGVVNLARQDAPLRRDCEDVCSGADFTPADQREAEELSTALAAVLGEDALLLPMALGHHIDHRIARNAALMASAACPIGFFEDLPYAIYYDDAGICTAVHEFESVLGVKLHPLVVPPQDAVLQKRRMVEFYRSQAGPAELSAILDHSKQYGGGERIWVDTVLWEEFSKTL